MVSLEIHAVQRYAGELRTEENKKAFWCKHQKALILG